MHNRFELSDYDETIRMVLESGGEFRIFPRGTSMLPFLVQERDSVTLIKPDGNLKKNDIAFYLRDDGHYVLHRVIKSEDGKYEMCGDNQLYIETGIENRHIIGVVSKVNRKGKEITEKSIGYRIYLFVWQFFIVRRIFFKFRGLVYKLRRLKNDGQN